MGGVDAILQESSREVLWREQTADRLQREVQLSPREWRIIAFHLDQDIQRLNSQNRYMTVLTAVVFFFMYQFLDLGGGGEIIHERGAMGVFTGWVDQFAQWGTQIFAILLFSTLFYLSGIQLQKYLVRYEACVRRLGMNFESSESDQ
jgi:hypothetical protein